jgi:hypothetical protein
MHNNDRSKLIVVLIVFGSIGLAYALTGKSALTKSIVAAGALCWFLTLWYFRRKKE